MSEETKEVYPAIRRVTRKDRKKASKLIEEFAEKSGNSKLTEMIPGIKKDSQSEGTEVSKEDQDQVNYELIKSVLKGLLEWVETDVTVWFMDLVGAKTLEEYDNMPFDTEMYIVEELLRRKSFTGFFTRALGIYKKTQGSTKQRKS